MSTSEVQDCQAKACSLQTCLNKHTCSPEKCDSQVMALYECCSKLYKVEANGSRIDPTSCPKQTVVARWLKKHKA